MRKAYQYQMYLVHTKDFIPHNANGMCGLGFYTCLQLFAQFWKNLV